MKMRSKKGVSEWPWLIVAKLWLRSPATQLVLISLCVFSLAILINQCSVYLVEKNEELVFQFNSEQKKMTASQEQVSALDPNQVKLANFYSMLGQPNYLEQQLNAIHHYAQTRALDLPSASYHLEKVVAGKFQRYTIKLKVRGQYPAIRSFVEDSLRYIPFLAMSDLTIKSGSGLESIREADIQFVLLLNEK